MKLLHIFSFFTLTFLLYACKQDPPPSPPPPPCPFTPVSLIEINERNKASLDLSNELKLELKKLPGNVPIKAEDVLKISAGISEALDKYTKTPVDVYLAGTMNTYLVVTICNTFTMLQQQTDPEQKAFYQGLLHEQFGKLTGFIEIYSSGRDPKPLPGCPPPQRDDTSKIENFMDDKFNHAKGAADRDYWLKRRDLVKGHIAACQESDNPPDCLRGLWKEVQSMYSTL